uniref:Uncharacterized protein n=1 Tax=Cucumis melo TaxID=3656 RepID=A0A9I9EF18_CUCME
MTCEISQTQSTETFVREKGGGEKDKTKGARRRRTGRAMNFIATQSNLILICGDLFSYDLLGFSFLGKNAWMSKIVMRVIVHNQKVLESDEMDSLCHFEKWKNGLNGQKALRESFCNWHGREGGLNDSLDMKFRLRVQKFDHQWGLQCNLGPLPIEVTLMYDTKRICFWSSEIVSFMALHKLFHPAHGEAIG